jgi:hypothetical protein
MADENNGAAARTQADIDAELAQLDEIDAELGDDDGIAPGLPRAQVQADAGVRAAEAEASKRGWVPKAKWVQSGKPADQWVDAGTFNKRGEAFTKNLQTELASVRAELESFRGTAKAFQEFQKQMLAEKTAELDTALKQLRLQRTEAIREGDDELALELEDKIDEARANAKAVTAEVKAPVVDSNAKVENPVLDEWIADGNEWFQTNDKLRQYAVALGDQMIAAGEPDRGRKFLDKVATKMREEFPKSFRTPAGSPPGDRVNGSGAGSGSGSGAGASVGGRTARDLPANDRALMRQFIAEGMYTEKEFLESYFSRN